MLSAHVWLIAAVFVPYLVLMVGLGWYIWRTGQPRAADTSRGGEEDASPAPPALRPAT